MEVSIDARTRLVALLGDPVEHSLSPLIHNSAFRAHQLNFAYVALRVQHDRVKEAVQGIHALGFAGANITAPHKQAVIPFLDELSSQARAVGAVNTIVSRSDGTLYGDNTDVAGFLAPLLHEADRLNGASFVVLGAGGAARAVLFALLTAYRPERLTIAARNPAKAERLARDISKFADTDVLQICSLDDSRKEVRNARLIVNATPVGTHPRVDESPWPDADDFSADQVVYDLVYNPQETMLLKDASARGAQTVGGIDMLIAQAAASYTQWTGHQLPTPVVREALRTVPLS